MPNNAHGITEQNTNSLQYLVEDQSLNSSDWFMLWTYFHNASFQILTRLMVSRSEIEIYFTRLYFSNRPCYFHRDKMLILRKRSPYPLKFCKTKGINSSCIELIHNFTICGMFYHSPLSCKREVPIYSLTLHLSSIKIERTTRTFPPPHKVVDGRYKQLLLKHY